MATFLKCISRFSRAIIFLFLLPSLAYPSSSDLSDTQINAAIERALTKNGDRVFRFDKQIVGMKRGSKGYVLSASDRIAVAAYLAKQRQNREFSVADARSLGLGMIAIVLVTTDRGKKGMTSGPTITLNADGTTIQPIPGHREQYHFCVPSISLNEVSNSVCSTFLFPSLDGAQKVTMIVTNSAGQVVEKEADPKLFELR